MGGRGMGGAGKPGAAGMGAGGATASSAGGMSNAGVGAIAGAGASAGDTSGGGGTARMCLSSNIDLIAATVAGKLTVNGAAISDIDEGDGWLFFSNAAGDYADLGGLPGSSYSALVAPGTYDLYFAGNSGTKIPGGSVKLRSDVALSASGLALDVDVPTTAVSTKLTLNGGRLPDDGSSGDGGAFLELRRGTDARLWLAYMVSAGQSTVAVPGTYDVYYSVYSRVAGGIPTNTSAKVQSGVVIDGSSASLAIDIPATPVSVSVKVAGAPITAATPQLTYLTLKNGDGDAARLTVTSAAGTSSALVVPGTYDLYYGAYGETCVPPIDCSDLNIFAPNVPKNASAKVKSGVVVGAAPLSLDIDLPATHVSGTVTVNGSVADGLDAEGLLTLTTAAGDSVALSPDATGAYSVLLLPGTYDLMYGINGRPAANGSALPPNFNTKLRSGIIVGTSALTLDIDIPAVTVAGSITLNGMALPPTAGQSDGDGWVSLTNADGAWVSLGALRGGSFSALVIPGTYDLGYSAKRDLMGVVGAGVPINNSTTLERGIVVGTSPRNLDVDVPAVMLAGAVTANGIAVTDQKAGTGALTLVAPGGSATVFATIPSSSTDPAVAPTGGYSELVIPGTYELYFQDYFSGSSVPDNERVDLGCLEVH